MRKRDTIFWIVLISLAVGFICCTVTWHIALNSQLGAESFILNKEQYALWEQLRKFDELSMYIDENYYKTDASKEDMMNSAYKGYVSSLGDPYSTYLTESELAANKDFTNGEYIGIGLTFKKDEGEYPQVQKVYDGSPAKEAGMTAGDYIISIDGEDTKGMDNDSILSKIRGPKNTSLILGIERLGERFDAEVTRKPIDKEVVNSRLIDEKSGYISMIDFSGNSADKTIAAFNDLKKQGAERFILDLRDNSGGLMNEAVKLCEFLVPEGLIVEIVERGVATQQWTSKGKGLEMPLVVLVNDHSASASEILVGVLRDYDAATIVGTNTFGKAYVQTTFELSDGKTAVKLTTGQYRMPKGGYTPDDGFKPDVYVELPESVANHTEELMDSNDTQLQKAIDVIKAMP